MSGASEDKRTNMMRSRIAQWLGEESFTPQTVNDPQAVFNTSFTIGGIGLNVVQDKQHHDSVFIGCRLTPPADILTSFKNRTTPETRRTFLLDLQTALLMNSQVSEFQFTIGTTPDEFQAVLLVSKRLYYDDLNKTNLIATAVAIRNLIIAIQVLMERYATSSPTGSPISSPKPFQVLAMSE
jgi:hypothetical protein